MPNDDARRFGAPPPIEDVIPDVRDGLTRVERVILWQLREAERERPGRNVSTALLYGRVVEHVNIGVPEFQRVLARLAGGSGAPPIMGTCALPEHASFDDGDDR